MNFELNEEQIQVRDMVREWAAKEVAPYIRDWDAKGEFHPEVLKQMGELGIFGIIAPEEFGGQGLDYLSYIIAVEELSRVDGSNAATVAAGVSLGIAPLLYFGTEEPKKKYLPKH